MASDIGIPLDAVWRYVEEQIFTLPGVSRPREELTILLTGSRATGSYTPQSDVDIDVVCPFSVYESIQNASLAEGRITSIHQSFYILRCDDWQQYFGDQLGRPHFSLTPIDEVKSHFQEYNDIFIWIWTNAMKIHDPGGRFQRILDSFAGYPHEVLVKKIKYRWMLAAYWGIDVFPLHPSVPEDLLPAASSLLNAVNELIRFFFLVEGRAFPYPEKLARFASSTELGRRFMPLLNRVVNLVVGVELSGKKMWERLDEAGNLLFDGDNLNCQNLESACFKAMLDAGIEPEWVKADYNNISELLSGKLGPVP